MKELIFKILQEYAVWGTVIVLLLAVFILARVNHHVKKLNRNFAVVGMKMQQYFEVIMSDEEEQEEPKEQRAPRREDVYLTQEERDMLLSRPKEKDEEDEMVFNAVLQEYFS